MLRRCLLLVLLVLLAVSAPAAWAAGVFVDISATDGNAQVWPTGVSTSGAVTMQGLNTSGYDYTYYNLDYYPGGTAGTMTNVNALFNNALTSYSTAMNDSGQFTPYIVFLGHHGWLYSGGTVSSFNVPYNGGNAFSTLSEAIDSNGDIGGNYIYSTGTTAQAFVYIGGTSYPLNSVAATYSGATITALNTAGQAVGWEETGSGIGLPTHHAEVWSYTISGGSLVSQTTADLQINGSLAAAYPGVESSQALAINNSGMVVVGAANSSLVSAANNDTAFFLYNMNTQAYTSLGNLMLYDPIEGGTTNGGGHGQAVDNAGQVVGRIDVSGNGSGDWHAAIWQNGVITDLDTEYAGILPAGFTLNNATAIDNNGDIAGWGTDASGNTNQAFVIINPQLPGDANLDGKVDINDLTIVLAHYNQTGMTWTEGEFTGDGTVDINDLTIVLAHYNDTTGSSADGAAAVPEPSTLVLIGVGAMGLLGLAWRRKQRA